MREFCAFLDAPPCRDVDEAEEAAEAGQEYEGHLVAHIKVPPTYFEAQQQSPASGTPHSLSRAGSDLDAGGAGSGSAPGSGGTKASSGPSTPHFAAVSAHEIASMLLPGAGAAATAAASSPSQQQQQQQSPTQQYSPPQQQQQQQPLSSSEAAAIRSASDSLAAALSTPHGTPPYR